MLTTIALATAMHAVPAQAFNFIRIGDVDGFGYVTGTTPCAGEPCWNFGSWQAGLNGSCSGFQLLNAVGSPVNVDGLDPLGGGDYLPDLDCSAETRYDSDEFDLRSAYELSGGPYGYGTQVNGATNFSSSGSGWTDVAVCGTGVGWFDCIYAPLSPHDYVCGAGQAIFIFDFEVSSADSTQPLYVNAIFADYDVDSASDILRYTTSSGTVINTTIATQDNSAGEDGLIQEATAVIPFADVFPNWSGGDQTGYLKVEFLMPDEPFVAYDYVELSISPLIEPEGCCCYQDASGWHYLEMTESKCDDAGGYYAGDGIPCGDGAPVMGACCITEHDGTLTCIETADCDCDVQGGVFYPNAPCTQVPCDDQDPVGCCCFQKPGSSFWMFAVMSQSDCLGYGGYYAGDGTECDAEISPLGACCFPLADGSLACIETSECECDFQVGTFYVGQTCHDVPCGPNEELGACCYIDLETGCYECILTVNEDECLALPKQYQFPQWQGANTTCVDPDITCCRQLGACCIDGECAMTIVEACEQAGGTSWNGSMICADVTCPDCTGDVNGDGTVNIFDLLAVIGNWGSCP